jgi:hypothetical protein
MNNRILGHQIIARLKENSFPYGMLTLQNDVSILISQNGGRVFGPFLSQDSESIFWINSAFAQSDSFKAFLNSGDWNLGGDRIWIAPEVQYNIQDRADLWGSYHLPEQVDPGRYRLDQPKQDQWRLFQDMDLELYNLASGHKELRLERLIQQVEDPLRNLSDYQDLIDGVIFAGYQQIVSLSESKQDGILSEAWSLIQLNPGGTLLIQASPRVEICDYYEPIDESLQSIYSNHVRLKITGDRRYKVGYKAAQVFGRLAYLNHLDDGRSYLIVRSFFNNPSAPYAEEPSHSPGRRGHSIHIYNDDGNLGGFGELECNAQTIGGATGRSSSTDQVVLWLYVGSSNKVKEIALHLLGIEI